jgi:hypothetical protein
MSVANYPFHKIQYLSNYGPATAIPATPLNQAAETSLVVLKDAATGLVEIVYPLPAGIYSFSAKCTMRLANVESSAQQIDLQIVRLTNAGGGAVLDYVATCPFALNRLAGTAANPSVGIATFANVANVAYQCQCARADLRVPAGQFWGVRVGVNGNPIGGSTISNVNLQVVRTGEFEDYSTILVIA